MDTTKSNKQYLNLNGRMDYEMRYNNKCGKEITETEYEMSECLMVLVQD